MNRRGRPKKIRFQKPKGTTDLLFEDWKYLNKIFDISQKILNFYRFQRIETPLLEKLDLFSQGLGLVSQSLEKELCLCQVKGENKLVLRAEGNVSIARAYIENDLESLSQPLKLWYWGPFFKCQKAQTRKNLQFWRLGIEIFGENDPLIDALIIEIFFNILSELKFKNLNVEINSLGDSRCRLYLKKILIKYLQKCRKSLCSECRKNFLKNPFLVLDCQNNKCQEIAFNCPPTIDCLCKECHQHFKEVLEYLEELKIPYHLNYRLIKGGNWNNKTVFQILEKDKGIVLAEGGRYDNLIKLLGGKETPAAGGVMKIDEIKGLMKTDEFQPEKEKPAFVFLAQLGLLAKRKSLKILEELRRAGIAAAEDFGKDSLKAQLARAEKLGVKYTIIIAQKEALEDEAILRDMETGEQRVIKIEELVKEIKK
jgi:histidyl-tRNA synthetase